MDWGICRIAAHICCLCCPTIEFCGIFSGIVKLVVNGFVANVSIGIVPLFCFTFLGNSVPDPVACGTDPRSVCGAHG